MSLVYKTINAAAAHPFLVVIVRHAVWEVLHKGGKIMKTDERRWECRGIPGNIVGYGKTEDEAFQHLLQTRDFAIKQEESKNE